MNKKQIHFLFLSFASFIFVMLVFRYCYTYSKAYVFLVWNLFLAYIPFALSYFITTKVLHRTSLLVACLAWLLFLPNAAYIITDFLHLGQRALMPIWFDIVLLFSSAFLGLMMGVVSIIFMLEKLQQFASKRSIILFQCTVSVLCGFGIYLGRYLRLNSWDVVSNPFMIWRECLSRVLHPSIHLQTWGITILFGVLHLFCIQFLLIWKNAKTIN
jgi:uncharacterized membrane protein